MKHAKVSEPLTANSSALLTPDSDLLATLGTGVTTAVLRTVQSHNEIAIVVPVTTGAQTGSVVGGTTGEVPLDGGSGSEGGERGNGDSREEHFGFRYDYGEPR